MSYLYRGALIALGLLVILLLVSMFYQVEPEAVGVVMTFGKFSHVTEPGLHIKLPYPVQTVTRVAVERQLKQEAQLATLQTRLADVEADAARTCTGTSSSPSMVTTSWSSQSTAKSKQALTERMLDALPEARLEVVPDAGHTVHLEQPDVWASTVESFV